MFFIETVEKMSGNPLPPDDSINYSTRQINDIGQEETNLRVARWILENERIKTIYNPTLNPKYMFENEQAKLQLLQYIKKCNNTDLNIANTNVPKTKCNLIKNDSLPLLYNLLVFDRKPGVTFEVDTGSKFSLLSLNVVIHRAKLSFIVSNVYSPIFNFNYRSPN